MTRHILWCLAGYVLVTLAMTYPLILHPSSQVAGDLGDPVLNVWILWWDAHALPLTQHWWDGPFFYPARGAMAFSESLLGISLITSPIQWLGGGPLFAYNIALLLSFPLAAVATQLLCYSLTRHRWASFIAGLAFAFAPYRAAHIWHIQELSSYWIPVSLLCLHRFAESRSWRALAGFGASWLLQSLCDGYYMLFFSVMVGVWMLWFLVSDRRWRDITRLLLVWTIFALPLVPVLLKYRQIHEYYGLTRGLTEILRFSSDLTSFFGASPILGLWGGVLPFQARERDIFPGVVVPMLILVAVMLEVLKVGRRPTAWPRLRLVLAASAAFYSLTAVSVAIGGPWRFTALGLHVSASLVHKQLWPAFACLLALGLSSASFTGPWRRRSVFAFYVSATALMFLLSFGPTVLAGDLVVLPHAPYEWLMALPGFHSLRVPARFAMTAMLGCAVSAGIAFSLLASRLQKWSRVVGPIVALAVLADGWIARMPLVPAPDVADPVSRMSDSLPVLELPGGRREYDTPALYRAIYHGHPLINGYSGYEPPHYPPLRIGLKRWEPGVLSTLAMSSPIYVVLNIAEDTEGKWAEYLSKVPALTLLYQGSGQALYLLPQQRKLDPGKPGAPIPIRGVSANGNATVVQLMVDRDLVSYWCSPAGQGGTEEVTIELESERTVAGVVTKLGQYTAHFPRRLRIEVSSDGEQWRSVWAGDTGKEALAAALRSPRTTPATFLFKPVQARLVRLRQLGKDPVFPWVIAELSVHAAAQ